MKKITSLIVIVTMLISCYSAFAATIDMIDTDLSTGDVNITISEAGEKSLIIVTNPGFTDEETENKKGAIQNTKILTSNENGEISYGFRLYNPANGEYKVYIDGQYKDSFTYDLSQIDNVVDNIIAYAESNDKEGLEVYLATEGVLKALALENYEPLTSTDIALDTEKLAVKLINKITEETFDGTTLENGAKMQNIIKTLCALELFNQQKPDEFIYNADGSLVYDSVLKMSGVDTKYSVTIYDYYIKGFNEGTTTYKLTTNGQSLVKNSLKGKNFESAEKLYEAFMKAVVCAGVNNSTISGSTGTATFGHIKGLLTNANKAQTGVSGNITSFIASKLAGTQTQIKDIEELNSLISQYAALEGQTPSGGGGGGGGGASAPGLSAGGSMTVTPVDNVDALKQNDTTQSENYKYSFSDIAEVEWAIKAIEDLTAKGILNGVGDRKFNPNGTVTREQFVKMLCVALNLTEETEITFTDIEADDWALPYIKKAVKAGLIAGTDENTFGYGANISRQDIAVILHRTIKDTKGTASFKDNADIADYAVGAVGALSGLKILNGFEDGSFKPNDSCTRAQAAVIIYNYLSR